MLQSSLFEGNYFTQVCFSQQFERLFQFARRIEDLMYTITPEEVSPSHGLFYLKILHVAIIKDSVYEFCKVVLLKNAIAFFISVYVVYIFSFKFLLDGYTSS